MPSLAGEPDPAHTEVSEALVLRKVSLRLIPFLFLLYVINLIDRTNIGIARLQMVEEQGILGEASYSVGAGIFYVGYLLFEVPSNLILARTGARTWIARILVTWGGISTAMMFVSGPWSFCVLRILLGVAEAGFFPGIILYLSEWFPHRARAHAVATFMAGGVIASMVGNPVSGFILEYMDQQAGLWGWQWVFLLEGLPAVGLGFVTLYFLTDRPEQALWLTTAEREWLTNEMRMDTLQRGNDHSRTLRAAFISPRVWLLIAVYFTVAVGDNTYGFYLAAFLHSELPTWSASQIGLLAAAPSVAAIVGMILIGRNSDRTEERRWHVAGSAFLASAGWLVMAMSPFPWIFVAGLAMATAGMKSMLPTFWALSSRFLSGTGAAGGIALINSVANLGGLIGPKIIGEVKTATGSFTPGFPIIALFLCAGGFLILCVREPAPPSTLATN